MAERQLKPLTQEEIKERYGRMCDVGRKMNDLDLAGGVDKDWHRFVESDADGEVDSKFLEAARSLTRQFMIQGYLMAMEDTLGVKTPEGRENFRGLLEEITFRHSSLYAQTCSPEAMLMGSIYVAGIGRINAWR